MKERVLTTRTGSGDASDGGNDIARFGLATAQILYFLPDYPRLLQAFILQQYDTAPHFPVLSRFVKYWEREIEAALHSVSVTHFSVLSRNELRLRASEFSIN